MIHSNHSWRFFVFCSLAVIGVDGDCVIQTCNCSFLSSLFVAVYDDLSPGSSLHSARLFPSPSPGHLDSGRFEMPLTKISFSWPVPFMCFCPQTFFYEIQNDSAFQSLYISLFPLSAVFSSFPYPSASTWIKWKWQHHLQMKGKCSMKWQVKVLWHKWDRLSYDAIFGRICPFFWVAEFLACASFFCLFLGIDALQTN